MKKILIKSLTAIILISSFILGVSAQSDSVYYERIPRPIADTPKYVYFVKSLLPPHLFLSSLDTAEKIIRGGVGKTLTRSQAEADIQLGLSQLIRIYNSSQIDSIRINPAPTNQQK